MKQKITNDYTWALDDHVDDETHGLLGGIPSRWGRMTPLSRVLIVEVGRLLRQKGIVKIGQKCSQLSLKVGLIGGTTKGSLVTDMDFIRTMQDGVGLASPGLFGYTLPNIPLAEVANHYGLVGPVYALFDAINPLETAKREARQLLVLQRDLSLMLACEFDHLICRDRGENIVLNLTLMDKK